MHSLLVRSFGTENRPTERPVAPRDEVYEYIIFRGSDIKDIKVCEPPKPLPTLQGGLPNDPAIIQVHLTPPPFKDRKDIRYRLENFKLIYRLYVSFYNLIFFRVLLQGLNSSKNIVYLA